MDLFWIILIAVAIIYIVPTVAQAQARQKAKAAYQESIMQMTKDPTDPKLRKRTLELGREYSKLTRDNKGVTLFDEVALMNDINAVCGGTMAIAEPKTALKPVASAGPSLEDRLLRLVQLKEQGLISSEEYQAKRQQLLDEV